MGEGSGPRRGRPRARQDAEIDEAGLRRLAVGEAIRAARGAVSQVEAATRLGVAQSSYSGWESGKVDMTLEQLRSIEDALGLARGYLAAHSGFVDVDELWAAHSDALAEYAFGTFEEMNSTLAAAGILGLGVRVWNAHWWDGPADFGFGWRMVVMAKPAVSAPTGSQP